MCACVFLLALVVESELRRAGSCEGMRGVKGEAGRATGTHVFLLHLPRNPPYRHGGVLLEPCVMDLNMLLSQGSEKL